MLGQFLKTDPALSRYRAAPFGPFLDGYIKARLEKGFAKPTLRRALQIITAFGEHLTALGVESVSDLDESYCDAFIDHYRSHARSAGTKRRSPRGSVSLKEVLRGSLRGLLAHLRGIGAIKSLQEASTPHSELVEEYVEFLRRHRGFADLTVAQHRNWASTFLKALACGQPPVRIVELSPTDVQTTVRKLAEQLGRRTRQIMTTTVESLLRYLRSAGHIPSSCVPFLPRLRTYSLAPLPSAIGSADIQRAVRQMNRATPLGRRDHAMLLLVATYGLRAGEVVGLRLDDLDWRRGSLLIRQTKTRRQLELPMMPEVRDALVEYLRGGRPRAEGRHLFQKVHAPRGPITRRACSTASSTPEPDVQGDPRSP